MRLRLRPALETDLSSCEALHRSNMASYFLARSIPWDHDRFLASWAQFDNCVIVLDDQVVGLLRLLVVDGALEIRDLQVEPKHQGVGIGSWAVAQAKFHATSRGLEELRLRVFADNPAQRLYTRLGFKVAAVEGDVVHMSHALPPGAPFKPGQLRGSD